jgi:hypothetical protein
VCRKVWNVTSSSLAASTAFSKAVRRLRVFNTRPVPCGPRLRRALYESSFRGTSRRLPLFVISSLITPRLWSTRSHVSAVGRLLIRQPWAGAKRVPTLRRDNILRPKAIACPQADAKHGVIAQNVLPFREELRALGGAERKVNLDRPSLFCLREHEQLIGLLPFGLRHLWVGTDLCERRGREDQQQNTREKMTRPSKYV